MLERLRNVGEFLANMRKMRRSLSDVLVVETELRDDTVCVTFDVVAPLNQPQAVDLMVGLGYVALSGATQGRWVPDAVHFTHNQPLDRDSFERFFQAPLVFNSDFNGFCFDKEGLNIALPLANKAMAENARRLLSAVQLPSTQALVSDHVQHSIMLLLRFGRANLREVAKNLNRTERLLQRQLRDEGTTFADLLNGVRRSLAESYLLRSTQSMSSIAEGLGYANLSSFTRWFEREFGTAPSHWRKAKAAS